MKWGHFARLALLVSSGLLAGAAACSSDGPNEAAGGTGGSAMGGTDNTGGTGGGGGTGNEGGSEPECPHMGDPVLEPSALELCPGFDNCRCLTAAVIPPENLADLADCDADQKCVPDLLVRTGGNFIPETCTSVGGAEGRCLATCLPAVAGQADLLPQDICGPGDKCAPCFDPFDGTETGACAQSCDPGPVDPPVTFDRCCMEGGDCIPTASIPPDQADQLGQDSCGDMDKCVPDGFADNTFVALACDARAFGIGIGPGACLPDCIPATDTPGLGQNGCPANHTCAPCEDLFGDPTGACDFLP